jgi:hypothetical protein
MVQTELSRSLRENLLWERQQNAQAQSATKSTETDNNYFETGWLDYHQKGW